MSGLGAFVVGVVGGLVRCLASFFGRGPAPPTAGVRVARPVASSLARALVGVSWPAPSCELRLQGILGWVRR